MIVMTPFTLIMAYYDNPQMLTAQYLCWCALPTEVCGNMHVIIVDDGSPRSPAEDVVKEWGPHRDILRTCATFKLFRIDKDIPWNQDAARNIGADQSSTDWMLLTDMDHMVPEPTWRRLMEGKLHPKTAYRFGRLTAPNMTPYHPHPNSWAITQKTFWKVGGYDERLAGNYGTDGDILNRIRLNARLDQLKEPLIRVPRDYIADASTTTLERKNVEQKRRINELISQRNAAGLKPLHFQSRYRRVI